MSSRASNEGAEPGKWGWGWVELDGPFPNSGLGSGQLWCVPDGEGWRGPLQSGCAGAAEGVSAEMTEVAFADYVSCVGIHFFHEYTLIGSYPSLTSCIKLRGFPVLSAGAVSHKRLMAVSA